MAIYHCTVKTIGRASGRSAVAAAAYRSGTRLVDERQQLVHDFGRKRGVVASGIEIVPTGELDGRQDWGLF